MEDGPLEAEGTDSTVSLVGDKVVVRRRGVKTLLVRGLALFGDPKSLTRAFEGPSKKVVTAALLENKELAKVIAGSVKKPGSAEEAGSLGKALTEALKENRQALVDALKANDTLVKAWLRDHKDLAGIVLKGDVHVFIADVTSVALANGSEGRRLFVLAADGNQLQVPFEPSHEGEFRALCQALAAHAGPSAGLSPPTAPPPAAPPSPAPTSAAPTSADPTPADPTSAAPAPPTAPPSAAPAPPTASTLSAGPAPAAPAETKTCPMCAEEIKAAAVLCRFCGHRFDEP
jgi:hypothetical protein